MSYTKGLVSVVIPTYKRSDMLRRAIDSVLGQTYHNVECIVVNDNTPGDEFSLILYNLTEEYKNDRRFHFLEQEAHKNGAAARNVGIRAAKGEYIAFLDDDDFWDERKVEVQISVLEKLSDDFGAVSCLMRFFRNGKVFSATWPYKDGNIHYKVLTRCISMGTGSLIIRRCALDETGYFDENLRRYQDPQIFSFLTEKYKVKLIPKYLHNRDVDDAQNRNPSIENINSLHEAFFLSVLPQLKRMSKKKESEVKAVYGLDKFNVYWHTGNRLQSLKFLFEICKYPAAVKMAIVRIVKRQRNRCWIKYRLEKYK